MILHPKAPGKVVDRRIGGLENWGAENERTAGVDRRIGGLEILVGVCRLYYSVDRRIGGLEIAGIG